MNKDLYEIQRLVQSFVASKQPERAIELLENVIKSDSSFVEAWMLLSSVYRALGQTDKAIEVCKKSLESIPNDSIIWVNLGHLYVENNQHEKAFEPLKKALSLDSGNPSAWYSLGMALLAKMEYDQAIEAFQKTVKLDPNRINAWIQLASTLDDTKQFTQAITAYKKALELQPSLFEALIGLGMTYVNNGDYLKAIDAYEKSLKINPNEAGAWFHLGTTLSKANKLDRAIDGIKEGLRIDPTIVNAWMDLKDVYDKKGDKEGASWAFKKDVATGKVDVMHTDSDDPKEIVKEVIEKIKERNTDSQIRELFLKERKLLLRNDMKGALRVINKILRKDPNNIRALMAKATLYWGMPNKYYKARIFAARALELEPKNIKILIRLAELTIRLKYDKEGKTKLKAMEFVERALKINPQSDEAWDMKGVVFYHLKNLEESLKCFVEAVRINPKNRHAIDSVKNIRSELEKANLKRVKGKKGTLNFLNPKIRKEKFAKQVGFDPVAFKPLTEDNMAYVHLDGNEKNDDPNTHAWVSKETYEMLKSGTALKGQKSQIAQQRELIEQHLETHLGGVNKILHDQRKDRYHIDIYILLPNDKRKYGVMVTSGMSDYAMNGPPDLKFYQFGEFYIKLPPDWPYPMEELKQDDYAWVFQNLYLLSRSVHENRTFFWNGQVIDNNGAFARNTELSGFLIKYPTTIDIPVEFNMLKVNPQKAICFYQLIPLYHEEMDFLEKRGLEKLYEKFDEYGITDIVDLNRPNVC